MTIATYATQKQYFRSQVDQNINNTPIDIAIVNALDILIIFIKMVVLLDAIMFSLEYMKVLFCMKKYMKIFTL